MNYHVFSVHDAKAEAFLPPFILPKRAQAIRAFSDCINSPDHQFGANPADYTLFVIGEWDDHTGDYDISNLKYSLGNGVEFLTDQSAIGNSNGEANAGVETLKHQSPVQPSTSGEDSA